MSMDFVNTASGLEAALKSRGLTVAANAQTPLRRIDFHALVSIHDHEEFFLRQVFFDSLITAHEARTADGEGISEMSLQDVRTAMLMLGAAAASAPEQQFSGASKSIIRGICPYCATVQMRAR